MKRKSSLLIAIILSVCVLTAFAACDTDEKQINGLFVVDSDGNTTPNLDLGSFEYKSDVSDEGDYPDLTSLKFKVSYSDNTYVDVEDDDKVKLTTITNNGIVYENIPEILDAGLWTLTYSYENFNAYVTFSILQSTSYQGFELLGMPSGWIYSELPEIASLVTVSGRDDIIFDGTDANSWLYYVTEDEYDEIIATYQEGSESFATALKNKARFYYYGMAEGGNYINAGNYYMFAELASNELYASQITKAVPFTVAKETLTFTVPSKTYEKTLDYSTIGFGGSILTGDVPLSDIPLPGILDDISATDSAGNKVSLTGYRWEDPDALVNSNELSGNVHKMMLKPWDEYIVDNFNLENLYVNVRISATKGSVFAGYDFKGEAPYSFETEVLALDYTATYFPLFLASNPTDDDFKFFKITDSSGYKLPIYTEYGTPIEEGDTNASATVIKISHYSGDKYAIKLNDAPVYGRYAFALQLYDSENYYWRYDYNSNFGSSPVNLYFDYAKNDNFASFPSGDIYYVDSDGCLSFDLEMKAAAYDESSLSSLTIEMNDKYVASNGVEIESDPNIGIVSSTVQATDTGVHFNQRVINVKVKLTFTDPSASSGYLCFTVKMNAAADYKPIEVSGFVIVYKYVVEQNLYYPQVRTIGSDEYVSVDWSSTYSVDRSLTIGEIFSGLDNKIMSWQIVDLLDPSKVYSPDSKFEEVTPPALKFIGTYKDLDYVSKTPESPFRAPVSVYATSLFDVKKANLSSWDEGTYADHLQEFVQNTFRTSDYQARAVYDRYSSEGLRDISVSGTVSASNVDVGEMSYTSYSTQGKFSYSSVSESDPASDFTFSSVVANANYSYSTGIKLQSLTGDGSNQLANEEMNSVIRDSVIAGCDTFAVYNTLQNEIAESNVFIISEYVAGGRTILYFKLKNSDREYYLAYNLYGETSKELAGYITCGTNADGYYEIFEFKFE